MVTITCRPGDAPAGSRSRPAIAQLGPASRGRWRRLAATAVIGVLSMAAVGQPSLAAAEAEAEPTAEAKAEAEPAAEPAAEPNGKRQERKARWAASGRPPGRVISDRWGFYVGGYAANITTDAAVGSGGLLGAQIRVESDLGLDDDDRAGRTEGFYRFNPRHGLLFGYWGLKRDGTQVIEEQIDFQGKIFLADATINTDFRTSWFRVAYRYSMVNTRRAEAGITAGVSSYNFKLGLSGDASFTDPNGVVQAGGFETLTEDIFAPVPTFGFFINYAMRPRLVFRLQADIMNLDTGDLSGSLVDTIIGVDWYFTRHVGVGLMSNTTAIEVKNAGDSPWAVDYRQRGWVGYFTFVFGSNIDKDKKARQPN